MGYCRARISNPNPFAIFPFALHKAEEKDNN